MCEGAADWRNVGAGAARRRAPLQRTAAPEAVRREEYFRAGRIGDPSVSRCWGTRYAEGALMPKDHDFKRLVRARIRETGERYTQARAALAAQREAGDPLISG